MRRKQSSLTRGPHSVHTICRRCLCFYKGPQASPAEPLSVSPPLLGLQGSLPAHHGRRLAVPFCCSPSRLISSVRDLRLHRREHPAGQRERKAAHIPRTFNSRALTSPSSRGEGWKTIEKPARGTSSETSQVYLYIYSASRTIDLTRAHIDFCRKYENLWFLSMSGHS